MSDLVDLGWGGQILDQGNVCHLPLPVSMFDSVNNLNQVIAALDDGI